MDVETLEIMWKGKVGPLEKVEVNIMSGSYRYVIMACEGAKIKDVTSGTLRLWGEMPGWTLRYSEVGEVDA